MKNSPADFVGIFDQLVSRVIQSFNSDWLFLSDAQATPKNDADVEQTYQIALEFESHNYFEICLCMDGELALEFDQSLLRIHKDDICVIFPGQNHRENPLKNGGHEAIWVLVNMDTITLMLTGKKDDEDLYIDWACSLPETAEKYKISDKLKMIKSESDNAAVHTIEYTKAIMLQILIILLRDAGSFVEQGAPKKFWKEAIVEDVKAFIETNFAQNFKLVDIAQKLCFSPNYLNTIFKTVTGSTIIKYTEELRTFKAQWFLKETDYSISCIASMLGYCDQYHFSKNFKKETGKSPTEFRRT